MGFTNSWRSDVMTSMWFLVIVIDCLLVNEARDHMCDYTVQFYENSSDSSCLDFIANTCKHKG